MKEQRFFRNHIPMIRASYALALGRSQREAARRSGVSTTTIWRWLQCENFQDLILQAQRNLEDNLDAEPEPDRMDATEAVAIFLECAEEIKLLCKV